MTQDESLQEADFIPPFTRRRLENPPLLPGESAREFRLLFGELSCSDDERGRTAADYAIIFEATELIWNLQRLERMRAAIIRHHHPAAVASLFRLTSKFREAEPGSVAYHTAQLDADGYFTSEEAKSQAHERFAASGFAVGAVEVEAFQQALPQIAIIDRQIGAARRQLLAFLKEIERRNARRAEQFRKVARNTISRVRASGAENAANELS